MGKFRGIIATFILIQRDENYFNFESIGIKHDKAFQTDWASFPDFETVFHQLMIELIRLQLKTI